MKVRIIFSVIIILLSGCATMSNGAEQDIKITTKNDKFGFTHCILINEEGEWTMDPWSMEPIIIHRDGNIMNITCQNEKQIGETSVTPSFSSGLLFADLLLDFCIFSCVIDGINNSFHEYPSEITVYMKANNNE